MVPGHHSQHYLPFQAIDPIIGRLRDVVAQQPIGAFNKNPTNSMLTIRDRMVVNHLLRHDF